MPTYSTADHTQRRAASRPVALGGHVFTRAEWHTLRALRTRYQQDPDLLSERERARVRFLRWLYQTGRLEP